jgi:hypothetical protein
MVLSCRPASAAVTATFSITSPNPDYAYCPTNVGFTGSITGPPGTNVTYIFARFVNGAPIDSAPIKATLPASGTLPVTETLNIGKADSGFQSNEMDVTAPNAAQGKVFFTVNCSPITTSTPVPFNHQLNNQMTWKLLPAPVNVASTTSAAVCGSHGGFAALFCPDALHNGFLVLVWDWNANALWPKAGGFRVYQVTPGPQKLVDTQSNGQLTISFQKPGAGGFGGRCYAVTAYSGQTESSASKPVCIPVGYTGRQSKVLHMFHWAFHFYQYGGAGPAGGLAVMGTKCTDLCLGWSHAISGSGITLTHVNTYWRSYLQFDPSQIAGLNVYKAFLKLRRTSGKPECFGSIGAADGQAWDTNNFPSASWETPNGAITNTGAQLDVTNIVRGWATGAPNFGFAFKGTDENTGADDNNSCLVDFSQDDALLSIEYY